MSPLLIITLIVAAIIFVAIFFWYSYNRVVLHRFRSRLEKRDFVRYWDEQHLINKTGQVDGFFNVNNEQFVKIKTIKSIKGGFITRNIKLTDVFPPIK